MSTSIQSYLQALTERIEVIPQRPRKQRRILRNKRLHVPVSPDLVHPTPPPLTKRDLKSWIPIFEMSTPSIKILPCTGSTNLRILMANVDLPLPVLPKRPTRSLALSWNETFFNTGGSSGAYLITKSSTVINGFALVLEGQYAGGRFDSMTAGASWGSSRYSTTRSTELVGRALVE